MESAPEKSLRRWNQAQSAPSKFFVSPNVPCNAGGACLKFKRFYGNAAKHSGWRQNSAPLIAFKA
jgi:hypothetical protein